MSKQDRLFLYAVACWIAQIDRIVTPDESDALKALGEKLGVPDRVRAKAEELATEMAALPDGDRPDRYDLGQAPREDRGPSRSSEQLEDGRLNRRGPPDGAYPPAQPPEVV